MLLIQNTLTSLVNKKWFTWTALAITLFIYFVGWGEDFASWPFSTIIYLIIGTTILLGKFHIDKRAESIWTHKARTGTSR